MPPATLINYVPTVVICFLFNHVIRRHHFSWWAKDNCASIMCNVFDPLFYDAILGIPEALEMIDVSSAALDSSYSTGILFIFFTLQYPNNGNIGVNTIQKGWGNNVYSNMDDAQGVPIKTLAAGETFGPATW